jgi:uncharacterized damage-inducible protein DinB
MMEFKLEHAIEILSRTPQVLRAQLQGLPAEWLHNNEGENTWSPYNVLGHLIHGEETDWIPRAKLILEKGESETFAPFDRNAQFAEQEKKSVEELLDSFELLRREGIQALQQMALTADDLKRTGTHPVFGKVTLEQLLATWVAHDQGHLVQIARTMAKQYRDAVGPWRAYLSVMS